MRHKREKKNREKKRTRKRFCFIRQGFFFGVLTRRGILTVFCVWERRDRGLTGDVFREGEEQGDREREGFGSGQNDNRGEISTRGLNEK